MNRSHSLGSASIVNHDAAPALGVPISPMLRFAGVRSLPALGLFAPAPAGSLPTPTPRRGFSVIELVLVVLLVAVLVSLLIPALGRTRLQARITKSQANAASHAKILTQYTADYRDLFPYFTDPNATKSVVRPSGRDIAVPGEYFDAFALWHIALADQYYAGLPSSPVFLDPVDPAALLYYYPCCFIARPEYWDPRQRLNGNVQWRPTRAADVLYPSQKSLISGDFFDTNGLAASRSSFVGFPPSTDRIVLGAVDGHAAAFRRDALGPLSPFESVGRPVLQSRLHTLLGTRGRDF